MGQQGQKEYNMGENTRKKCKACSQFNDRTGGLMGEVGAISVYTGRCASGGLYFSSKAVARLLTSPLPERGTLFLDLRQRVFC